MALSTPHSSSLAPNLDLLRALAVGFVFYAHMVGGDAHIRTGIGRFGVLIFFVHTSLVLMMSMERMGLSARNLWSCFYVRRAFRIYPLSIATVILMAILKLPPEPTGVYQNLPLGDFLSNLALTLNLTNSPSILVPLWSLPIEVQMYLVLPAIYLAFRRRSVWGVLALWAVTALVALPDLPSCLTMLDFAPCFVAGVVAYRMRPRVSMPGWLWPPFILVLCAAFSIPYVNRERWAWVLCLVLGLAIPQFKTIPTSILRSAAALVAKYSYGIYLSHMPIMWFAFRYINAPKLVNYAIFLPLSAAVPVAMFHLIENPGIRVGVRLARRLSSPAPVRQNGRPLSGLS